MHVLEHNMITYVDLNIKLILLHDFFYSSFVTLLLQVPYGKLGETRKALKNQLYKQFFADIELACQVVNWFYLDCK